MSHRLSARWGHPFTGSDSSMPAGLVQGGTGPVHVVLPTLRCHQANLCRDVLFETFHPFSRKGRVWPVSCLPLCRCDRIILISFSWSCRLWFSVWISLSGYRRFVSCPSSWFWESADSISSEMPIASFYRFLSGFTFPRRTVTRWRHMWSRLWVYYLYSISCCSICASVKPASLWLFLFSFWFLLNSCCPMSEGCLDIRTFPHFRWSLLPLGCYRQCFSLQIPWSSFCLYVEEVLLVRWRFC